MNSDRRTKRLERASVVLIGVAGVIPLTEADRSYGSDDRISTVSPLVGRNEPVREPRSVATGAGATYELVLAAPPIGQPPYPESVWFQNGTLDLPGGPLRIWLEIRLRDWDADHDGDPTLGSWQATLDTSTVPSGPGQIGLAVQPCTNHADCIAAFGPGSRCAEPVESPQFCTPGFQDLSRCEWAFDVTGQPSVPSPYNTFAGTTVGVSAVQDHGTQIYGGTLVLDVSPDATGYHSDFFTNVALEMLNGSGQPLSTIPPAALGLRIPQGRCCAGASPQTCRDDLSMLACERLAQFLCFWPDIPCDPFPASCPACISHAVCNDGDACTFDFCFGCEDCGHTKTYDPQTQCCNPSNAQTVALSDNDPCTFDHCGFQGQPIHDPIPTGGACDDGDPCTINTTCDAAHRCVGSPDNGPLCPKNRYVSFSLADISPGGCHAQHALRVTLESLPLFPTHVGDVRWVGPPTSHPAGNGSPTPFIAAGLQCNAHFSDWTSVGLIHVYGPEVVPGSVFRMNIVSPDCPDLNDPDCFFGGLPVATPKWGDVAVPFGGASQPNFGDVSALVDVFKNREGAPLRLRAQLRSNLVDPSASINFLDIAMDVAAFQGKPYPFTGPGACP